MRLNVILNEEFEEKLKSIGNKINQSYSDLIRRWIEGAYIFYILEEEPDHEFKKIHNLSGQNIISEHLQNIQDGLRKEVTEIEENMKTIMEFYKRDLKEFEDKKLQKKKTTQKTLEELT